LNVDWHKTLHKAATTCFKPKEDIWVR
jgi:hypothetical protein